MKYMGSKNRISKNILPFLLRDRKPDQYYVEPMVGGCNMIDKVAGLRIGNDSNKYLIALFMALQKGWEMPSSISNEEYDLINKNKDHYSAELVGFVGFNCTWGSKFFGGYARSAEGRNYCLEGKKNLLKQLPMLMGIEFKNEKYQDLVIPENSIIYCDPPYKGTTEYKDSFDHDFFYEWCFKMKHLGHYIYISEYEMPNEFKCIFSVNTICDLTKKNNKRTEKLYTL